MARQIAISSELVRLQSAGDRAGIAALMAKPEAHTVTEAIGASLEKVVAEERRLLATRRAESETNGRGLLAIDLAGVVLIVVLAIVLTLATRRSSRELEKSLTATMATNEALEAAVAERTEHLVKAPRGSAAFHRSAAKHLSQHGRGGARHRYQGPGVALQPGRGKDAALSSGHDDRAVAIAEHGLSRRRRHAPAPPRHAGVARVARRGIRRDRNRGAAPQRQLARPSRHQRPAAARRLARHQRRGAALSRHHRHRAKPSASCSNRRRWTPSASSPAASRTTSTTC